MFTTRIEDGESRMQGICLKCAYEAELPGIEQLLSRAGINQDNIDEITAQMNEVLADISAQSPEDLLKALLSGEMSGMMPFTGADAGLFSQNADRSDGEDENEDAPDSRESVSYTHLVSLFNHIKVMFDYDDCITCRYESLQNADQSVHVRCMKTRCRFIENQERAASTSFR